MTRMVSSGLGPTSSSLTSPSFRSSSVSRTVTSSEKYLVVENQVANPTPKEVKVTLAFNGLLPKKGIALTLLNDLKNNCPNFIFYQKISLLKFSDRLLLFPHDIPNRKYKEMMKVNNQCNFLVIPWVVIDPCALLASSNTGFLLSFVPDPIWKRRPQRS